MAEWIEHNNTTLMVNNVDEDEKKLDYVLDSSGQRRKSTFLTEDGLYEVLMQSRKPIAKAFKKEVKKILKQIRATGGYVKVDNISCNVKSKKVVATNNYLLKLKTLFN